MITHKSMPIPRILQWTWRHIVTLSLWATVATAFYHYSGWADCISIPWLPISLVGTAVAFYVGFKNNSSYDRMWEARKIWGAIVNSSRSWGIYVKSFISNQFVVGDRLDESKLFDLHRRMIYRHIAWLYALRSQLLMVKEWEHASQPGLTGKRARKFQKEFGVGLVDDEVTVEELRLLLNNECDQLINYKNTATQIIDRQSQELQQFREQGLIDDFRHMEMQKILSDFYVHQGKCERIKNFPLPRQYANSSSIFVGIFLFLLPFGMASEFDKLGEYGLWWSIPFTVLVGWVFNLMESIGDFSENPFQGMANDIPMLALCRTIEIDLREMLGETETPPPITAKQGVLM